MSHQVLTDIVGEDLVGDAPAGSGGPALARHLDAAAGLWGEGQRLAVALARVAARCIADERERCQVADVAGEMEALRAEGAVVRAPWPLKLLLG